MTQEEKSLLFQDLCARLSYGVNVKCGNTVTKEICELVGINAEISTVSIKDKWEKYYLEHVASIKPYLRPMSSMTEEEYEEYYNISYGMNNIGSKYKYYDLCDWLNAHHLDYRGLIEKGLALVALGGMYN